uniref:Cadherin n=1 Tax=Panagrolaimus superbus TaxID=310955 RepID=A0A914YF43_9BILA
MIGALLWLLFFQRCFHLSSAYSEKSYEFFVTEESPKNTFVGRVALNGAEKYRISAPNPIIKDLFYIDFTNGYVKTLNRIDRDHLNVYNNTIDLIIVSQSASLISIHIHILDINDNAPQFSQKFYNISIVEGAIIGSKFPLQTAKDPDYGMNGTIAAYRLKSDDPETLNLFKVHRMTDIIGGDALFLELINALDRETRSSYTVEIEAIDGGQPALAGTFILFITILDVNDNAPIFVNPFLNVTIDTNGKENEIIARMSAIDADIGLNAELSYALVDTVTDQFEIDSITGEIRRKASILQCNKESCSHCLPNICVIPIEVSDKGVPKLVGRSFLNVHLTHHKFIPLEINIKIYPSDNNYLVIDENVQIGSTLAVLTVNDNHNNKIEMSIISGNDKKIFQLEHGHGFAILRLNKKVDFKKEQKYLLIFEAIDSSDILKKAQKSLQVYVRNANEKPPKFKEKRYSSNIFETTFQNSPILRIKADSENSDLRYSIINETLLPFNINPETGVIKLSKKLNYSDATFFEFQVQATNPAPSWKSTVVPVRINILDSNNNAPKFYEKISQITLAENFDIAQPIFQAKCLDMDYEENAAIRYQILNSHENHFVRIVEESGKIYLKNELDYEKVKKFAFDVICQNVDESSLSDNLKVLVFVEDINDNFPYFEQTLYHANLYIDGTEIITISAQDDDEMDKHNLSYFLINAPIGYIDVEKSTGKIFTLKKIDINTIGLSFNITIGAKDSEKHLSTNNAIIIVHIIENFNQTPLFDYSSWVFEMEENTLLDYLIENITAMSNETIEYSLLQGSEYLKIDQKNGELRIKKAIDYEKIKEIPFTVLAKTRENVNSKHGTIVVLDVNDNPPKFINPKHFIVDLSKLAIGESFGKLTAIDADSGLNGEIFYTSMNEFLIIDKTTGTMWLNPKISKEKENQWQVTVEAKDKGSPSLSATIKLIIDIIKQPETVKVFPSEIVSFNNDVAINLNPMNNSRIFFYETINISSFADFLSNGEIYFYPARHQLFYKLSYMIDDFDYHSKRSQELMVYQKVPTNFQFECLPNILINIPENAAPGSAYYTELIANMNNQMARFKLLNEYETFMIDSSTGSLLLLKTLDAEIKANFSLDIEIMNRNKQRTKCNIKVIVDDINDNLPIFEKSFYYTEILKNVSGKVITVKASDNDITIKHNQIRYSLDEKLFKINQSSGVISIASSLEANKLYNITAFAKNLDEKIFAKTIVMIKVLPDLTQKPVLLVPQEISIPELTDLGSVITTVSALSDSQTVTFKIIDGNLFSTFEIDPHFGQIILVRRLDFEKIQQFTLTLMAQTQNSNTTAVLNVKVENERDVIPVIISSNLTVQENQKPKSFVGKIEIEDDELRPMSDLHFKILYQFPPNGRFYISENNGLFTGDWLNREKIDKFQLLISVTDKKANNLKSEKVITVIVSDENDNMPECNDLNAFLIPKTAIFPFNINMKCNDKDAGYNASIGYKMIKSFSNLAMDWNGNLVIKDNIEESLVEIPFIAADRMSFETRENADALKTSSNSKFVLIKENSGKLFTRPQSIFKIYRTSQIPIVIGNLPRIKNSSRCFISQESSIQTNIFSISENSSNLLLIKSLPPNEKIFHLDIIGFDTVTHKTQIHKITFEIDENNPNGQFYVPVIAYEIFVNENISIGKTFEKLQVLGTTATNLEFQFQNDSTATAVFPFEINKKTGEICAKGKIDFEKEHFYQTDVIISSKVQTVTIPVYFYIIDINDNAPIFKENPFNFFIREDATRNEFIGHIITTDLDNNGNDRVRYQLINAPSGLFILDTISGILTLGGELDHEKQAFYEFKVRAYDSGGLEAKGSIFVFIEDVNDNAPKFDDTEIKVVIPEDIPVGTLIHSLIFDDADIANTFNFEIDPSTVNYEHFRIDNFGNIYVNNILEREKIQEYELLIILKDSFYPFIVHEARKTVLIIIEDVNDNPPYFTTNYTFIINEGSEIGTVIGNVVALDPDIDTNELNSLIQYRIDPFSNPNGIFMIDPLFGYIILNKKLDYELKSLYHLTVIAMDNGNPNFSSITEITVIVTDDDDNMPILLSKIEEIHFDEDIPIGTLIAKVEFEDKDEGVNAEAIFDIVNGNEDEWFRINTFTGHIFVNRQLDFETQENFTLKISMIPFTGKFDATFAIFNIFLNDKNDESPIFVDGNQKQINIAENITTNYPLFIYQFKAIDNDANSTTKYSILSGNSTLFFVDPNTGDLFINNALDYETDKSHLIVLKASDLSNSILFSKINVNIIVDDVNDNSPIFTQPYYMIEIPENFYTNNTLITIKATDADENENGEIYYTIGNNEAMPFIIDYLTGELKAIKAFDYEKRNWYTVIVRVTDNGRFVQLSNDVEVRISIKDENDNSPIFHNIKQDVFIKSNARKGSIIFVVDAIDYDSDEELILSLGGPDEKYFTIDKRGVIRVKSTLPKRTEFYVTVIATDSSNATSSLSLNFYSAVEDIFPIFQMNETRFSVFEDKMDHFITKVSADGNKCIQYTIASGNVLNNFVLDSFTGELIAKYFDYERIQEHHLYISATNCHSSLYTTYQAIIVSIKDINDNKPIFERSLYELKIKENSEPSKDPIVQVVATDADKSDHVTYQLLSGNYNNAFEIDATNGKIFQLLELDREEHKIYELIVEASDNGNNSPLKEICIVKIIVLDENDNAPRFSRLLKTNVLENAKVGDFVTQIITYDPDTKANARNFYSIEGDDAHHFSIDPISGNITVAKILDKEKQKLHKIKVYAQDKIWRVSASMTIFVEDVNDNAPEFISLSYNFSVLTQHSKNGYFVGTVKAIDSDEGINKKLTYYTYSPYIYIYPESGEIFFTRNLSYFPADFITAEIFAIDYGVPSNVGSTKVNIYLLDKYLEPPIFEYDEYIFGVETPVGKEIVNFGNVKAKVPNNRIHYELSQPSNIVSIDSGTGELSANFNTLKFDDSIELTIKANDYMSNTPGITNIIIKAVERQEIEFKLKKHAFIIHENTPLNGTVGYVGTSQPYVNYSILSANESYFGVESKSGRIFVAKEININHIHELKIVELFVEASFNGYPSKSKSTMVTVQIINKNNNPPVFSESQKILYFTNTIPMGAEITTVNANDIDEPPFNEVFYSLSKQDLFDIDSKSGKIFAINDIDFSLSNQHSFDVIAANFNSTTTSKMTVIIQLRMPFQNTAIFVREKEKFEISRRSIISSIIGQLEAHSVFGKNYYFIKPNENFIIEKNSANLNLNKKLENSNNYTVSAIVKSGMLNRKAPNMCRIQIITNELAPSPVFPEKNYIVKILSTVEPLTEVLRFNFILPSDVQMEIEGKGREAFCFDKRGVLMVCKKLQLKRYNLIMYISSNGRIRSKANIEIRFFCLNSSSGILSTSKSFDREKRSLYTIPISAKSSENEVSNISVNVFIDDEDDNEMSNEKLDIVVSSPKPLFTGIIPWIYPVDVDEVFMPSCTPNEVVPHNMIEVTSNCSLIANETPMGKSTFEATFVPNITYKIETNFLLNNDEISQNSIIVEMYGSRRAVADFMQKLQASIPDMVVHYLGANFYSNHTCQIFITILSQSGIVLPPTETLRILDNFISKKSKALDIINYRSKISLCDSYPCGTQTCQQSKLMTKEWETFRSINKLWTMPQMHGIIKCESKVLGIMNEKEQICGKVKCYNGICMDNSICICNPNYYGDTCESKVYTFGKNSYLKYEPMVPVTHLTIHLLTKESHGLLLFSQSKTSNVTFILDFFNGKLRMISISGTNRTSVVLQETINDSHWHKIIIAFQQTGTISVVIENCEGDECLPCQKTNCFGIIPSILLDSTIFIGGLDNENLNLIETTQMSSASLKACLKIVEINKKSIIEFEEKNMLSSCPLLTANNNCDSTEAKMSCQKGTCINEWEDYKCFCEDGFESPSCNMDDYTVTLNNAHLRLELSAFIRQELIFSHFKNSKVEHSNNNFLEEEVKNLSTLIPCDSIEDTAAESDEYLKDRLDGNAIQWLEIDIRTADSFANIFSMKYGSQHASLKLVNGTLHYGVYYLNKLIVEIIAEKFISDTKWHRIGIEVSFDGKFIRLIIDGINKEVESAIAFPRMIFRGLDYIDFGASGNESFRGCLRRLIINHQTQLLYPKMRSLSRQVSHPP